MTTPDLVLAGFWTELLLLTSKIRNGSTTSRVDNGSQRTKLMATSVETFLVPEIPLLSEEVSARNFFKNSFEEVFTCTGRERLIQSHSSARFSFELSGNSN